MTGIQEKRQQTGNCYKLLSIFFHEPEIQFWSQEKLCKQLVILLNSFSPEAGHVAEKMTTALEKTDNEQMKIDYAALFMGPYQLIAPPYGSVYLENTKRVMGDSTVTVLSQYREAGLRMDVQEPADHIAIELEFMHYLYSVEAGALDAGEMEKAHWASDTRKNFLSSYMLPWISLFCQNIRTGTTNSFYRNLADCLEMFIHHDAHLIEIAASIPEKKQKNNADRQVI